MMCHNRFKVYKDSKSKEYELVPCGYCISCRINRQNDWVKRITDELLYHDNSAFVTLTYNDSTIPTVGGEYTLHKKHYQHFVMRLRKRGKKLKYYMTGEYGSQTGRPHYHAIMFGMSKKDKQLIKDCWPHGHIMVGDVVSGGAEYVAKHQNKYDRVTYPKNGVQYPPYQIASKGIGLQWITDNKHLLLNKGHELSYLKCGAKRSVWLPAPRYYVDKIVTPEEKKKFDKQQLKDKCMHMDVLTEVSLKINRQNKLWLRLSNIISRSYQV